MTWAVGSTDDASSHFTRFTFVQIPRTHFACVPTEETKRALRRIMTGVPRHGESRSTFNSHSFDSLDSTAAFLLLPQACTLASNNRPARFSDGLSYTGIQLEPAGSNVKSLSSMVAKLIKHVFITLITPR